MYEKSNSFLYKFAVNSPGFLLRQGVPYKAENWHVLSHEQFLGICRCTFKVEETQNYQYFIIPFSKRWFHLDWLNYPKIVT